VILPVEDDDERLLRPGSPCWRLEHVDRLALLVDGAAYFHAMKAAMQKAQHSILLSGWDFDPRVQLEPDLEGTERSEQLCGLLKRLLAQRPSLQVHILVWDMALPFAIQRRDRPQRAGDGCQWTGSAISWMACISQARPTTRRSWSSMIRSPSAAAATSLETAGLRRSMEIGSAAGDASLARAPSGRPV
jgi:hypothetical protein